MEGTSERIAACIAVEHAVADAYNAMSNMFPEARDFFFELSREEVNHATILEVASGYNNIGKLPKGLVPESLPSISATLDIINGTREKLRGGQVSLREALEMSIAMENSKAESYLQETLAGPTRDRVVEKLKKLLIDERSHIQRIYDFMEARGMKVK